MHKLLPCTDERTCINEQQLLTMFDVVKLLLRPSANVGGFGLELSSPFGFLVDSIKV